MASTVQICNLALSKIGEESITALSDNSQTARHCALLYEPMRDAVLQAHAWNFATSRVELGRSTDTPAFGYAYNYALPADCVRVIQMEDPDTNYKVEGRNLLTDASEAKIIYIKSVTDPNQFTPLFIEALSARLAMELAIPITDSNTLTRSLVQLYEAKIQEARQADATEGTPNEIIDSTWISARYGFGG
ncbi:MAG: hypothetical protein HQL50_13445 [Magnetococcales bacterium]|nr:hypothetical protein [Magnetococcales bacterium]